MDNKQLESLLTVKKRDMNKQEIESFIIATMAYKRGDTVPQEIRNHIIYHVLEKRLIYFKVPVEDWLKVFISCLCNTPGIAVMWTYTLFQMHKEIQREINIHDFSEPHYFGMGLPEETEYQRIWESQKVKSDYPKSDNALDDDAYWK